MEASLISTFVVIILLGGCATIQNTAGDGNMQLIDATYKHWSHPPASGSDVPERGTDLRIKIRNWPPKYSPEYVIYKKQKSSSAVISQKSDSTSVITARVVRMSALLQQRSDTVDLSDRLVYKDDKGKTRYIEISSWQQTK